MKKEIIYHNDYKPTESKEFIEGETLDAIYEKFFKMNNRLRYCNGSYWKFADAGEQLSYGMWKDMLPNNRSFDLYYGNGVVD